MEDLLGKIRAVHQVNNEIVARIESQTSKRWFAYHEIYDDEHRLVRIGAQQFFTPTSDILNDWKMVVQMEPRLLCQATELHGLVDAATLTLDWETAKRLNQDMIREVEELRSLLDPDPDKTGPEIQLQKYLSNYETLQVAFGDVETKAMSESCQVHDLDRQAGVVVRAQRELGASLVQSRRLPSSNIMTSNETAKVMNWFCGGGTSTLNLLYRASRDGMKASDFHRLCDEKGPTVTVVKCCTGSGQVFGGFLGVSWNSAQAPQMANVTAALFTLRNKTLKFEKREDLTHQTHCCVSNRGQYGPIFGGDLIIGRGDGTLQAFTSYFGSCFQGQSFLSNTGAVDDVEVFSVASQTDNKANSAKRRKTNIFGQINGI